MSAQIDAPKYTYLKRGALLLFLSLLSLTQTHSSTELTPTGLEPLKSLDQIIGSIAPFELRNSKAFFDHRKKLISRKRDDPDEWAFCKSKFQERFEWPVERTPQMRLVRCYQNFLALPDFSPKYAQDFRELILHWARQPTNLSPFTITKRAFSTKVYRSDEILWYNSLSFIANLAQWYVFYAQQLNYSEVETAAVEEFLISYLLNTEFKQHVKKGRRSCPKDASKIRNKKLIDADYCGSVRFKVATGKLMLGSKLKNKELLESGITDLEVSLSAHDKDGYFVPYTPSQKQGWAFSYYYRQAKFLSVLVEIYAIHGFDFLSFEMPNGATVKQSLDLNFEITVHNHQLLDKYPGDGSLYDNDPRSNWDRIKTIPHEEFIVENLAHDGRHDPANSDLQFAQRSPRYASEYVPAVFARSVKYLEEPTDDFSSIYASSLFFGSTTMSSEELVNLSIDKVEDKALKQQLINELKKAAEVEERLKELAKVAKQEQLSKETKFESALADIGLTISQNIYQASPNFNYHLGPYVLYEIVPTEYNTKYRVRFRKGLRENRKRIPVKNTITFFQSENEVYLGANLRLQEDDELADNWQQIGQGCGFEDQGNHSYIEIPINSDGDGPNAWSRCAYLLIDNEVLKSVVRTLTHIGATLDPRSLTLSPK